MKDRDKPQGQLIKELTQLRRQIAELEKKDTERKQAEESVHRAKEYWERTFDAVPDLLAILDTNFHIIQVNKAMADRLNLTPHECIGQICYDAIHKTKKPPSVCPHAKSLTDGLEHIAELREERLGGDFIVSTTPLFESDGRMIGCVHIARDITERKRAEDALRDSEARYRAIVEAFDGLIYVCSQDYRIEFMNKQLFERTGYDGTGGLCYKVLHDLESVCPWCVNDRVFAGETVHWEVQSPKDDRWYYVVNTPIYHTDGSMSKQAMILDVTERKQAEMALRESEERFRKVVETMKVGLATTDEHGILTYVNEFSSSMIGYSVDDMIGHDPTDFYYDDEERKAQKEIFEKRRKGMRDAPTHEVAWRTKDGRKIYSILTPAPMFDAEGRYQGSFAIHTEITERKRIEEALRESEEKYRQLINGMNDTAWVIDFEGKFIDVNDAAVDVIGYSREELLSMGPYDIDNTLDAEEIRALIKEMPTDKIQVFETTHTTKDGKAIPVEIKSSLVTYQGKRAILSIARDITERKRAEEALRQSYHQLRETFYSLVNALISTVEKRDPYTAGHQRRTTILACAIAEEMGLSEERIEGIRMAGAIHDIGKIEVPIEILSRPGSLTDVQYEMVKIHPQTGHDILKGIKFPWPVAEIVLQHHERMNGSGYPQGIKGEKIMMEARILAVADVIEAISHYRPFRPSLGIEKALEEISQNRGVLFDPDVVDACIRLFAEKEFKFE